MVIAAGLGPFAGTLALALHTTGVLGRLFAESAGERAAPRPSARCATPAAARVAAFAYATLPLVTAQGVAYALYRWEMNIRMAAVLGFVGAGGLGQMLYFHLSIFQQAQAATLLIGDVRARLRGRFAERLRARPARAGARLNARELAARDPLRSTALRAARRRASGSPPRARPSCRRRARPRAGSPSSRSVAAASVEILPNSQQVRMRARRVGQLLVDAQLELAARQQARAGHVAGLVGVASRARRARSGRRRRARRARLQLGQRHERHRARSPRRAAAPTVLPPLMLVRSASVRCVGIVRLRLRIICDERRRARASAGAGCSASSSPIVEWLRPL